MSPQEQDPTSPAASTVSLASSATSSTATNSSTATLIPKNPSTQALAGATRTSVRPPVPPKDFEASFANLSASYGFAGHAPTKPAKKKEKSKKGKGKVTTSAPAPGNSDATGSSK